MALNLKLNKVLISDEIDQNCVNILSASGLRVDKKTKLTKNELIHEIKEYDGLVVRSATKVTKDVIEAGTNLKIIGRAGTGVDNIDCQEATRRGIIVMNTPSGNTRSAAELTCAFICSLAREIPEAVASLKSGKWDRKCFMGNELSEKTLAIIGLGRIGRDVAHRMQAFGMRTIGFDPLVSVEESKSFHVEWLSLDEIWPLADYITVHTPLIPQTKNLINSDVFKKVKHGVRIINAARGGIVDEAALLDALKSGQCGGAALDVYTEEPPTFTELIKHPKVICMPHLGANTHEAQSRVAAEIAQQLIDASTGKGLYGAINASAVTGSLDENSQAEMSLAESLGKVTALIVPKLGSETSIQLTRGSKMSASTSTISAAFCCGLLSKTHDGHINLINAPALAKVSGLQINVEKNPKTHSSPCLDICVTTTVGRVAQVSGVSGPFGPQLVTLQGQNFFSPPSLNGNVIFILTSKVDAIIASCSKMLNDDGNNVRAVSVSDPDEHGKVWVIMQTSKPTKDTKPLSTLCNSLAQIEF